MTLSSAPASADRPRPGRWLAPVLWGLVVFMVYFHYARYIDQVGWNAIELIISQKLTGHGVYATSLDYPSAIAWRPVVPTLVVTRGAHGACALQNGTLEALKKETAPAQRAGAVLSCEKFSRA